MSVPGYGSVPELHRRSVPWSVAIGEIHVWFGAGERARLPELVSALGGRRPLLVTDPGVRDAARVEAMADALRARGQQPLVFDEVEENPTTEHVARGQRMAREHRADVIVGIGGGSAMDAAKGVNFLLTNGGTMEDYQGFGRTRKPLLPSIGVPTTAGTGSEAQSYALIARAEDHRKMACGDPGARFREVVLDPELLATVPRSVAFASGIDAVAHAVESFVCTRANTVSRMYAREAFRLLHGHLETYLAEPDSEVDAGRMLLGAHLAGAAIESSMLGAAHACANPLTARHGLVHGVAVGLMLPRVVEFNTPAAADAYGELLEAAGAGDPLPELLRGLWRLGGLSRRLSEHGVRREELPKLAAEAASQWTASFNPRPVGEREMLEIYESAY